METTYQKLLKEKDHTLSYSRYNSSPYKGNPELEKVYKMAYYDGLDVKPGRSFSLEQLTDDSRKAYIHGFFTGDTESMYADD